jgi:uncharacterized protein YktB (UPF0637 family)
MSNSKIAFGLQDFDSFLIPGLEPRMSSIIEHVRPKLTQLGAAIEPFLSTVTGQPMYTHVAKHARRTINPPNDTWVAWSNNKRGYKAHPHFQVGMFASHLFIYFAVIYESTNKVNAARYIKSKKKDIMAYVPGHYVWSMDHMQPEALHHHTLKLNDLNAMADKLVTVKKSELLCGIHLDKNDPIVANPDKLQSIIEQTFLTLLPLYHNSF